MSAKPDLDAILNAGSGETEQKKKSAAAEREAQRDKQIQEETAAIDTLYGEKQGQLETEKAAVGRQFEERFDTNAVAELINRRQAAEAMANLGLTDSGLNRATQTSITTARGYADAAASREQQAAADKLSGAIAELLAEAASKKQARAAEISAAADADIRAGNARLDELAYQAAMQQYGIDSSAYSEYQALRSAERQAGLDPDAKTATAAGAAAKADTGSFAAGEKVRFSGRLRSSSYTNSAALGKTVDGTFTVSRIANGHALLNNGLGWVPLSELKKL